LNCNPASSNSTTATTVTDADGNVYHTVKIGTQTWTVENLKTTHYNDGTAIYMITGTATDYDNMSAGGCCWYNNDSSTNKNIYGALYSWYAVNTGKLAPSGWHVPTDADWSKLSAYLGGDSVAGGKLKDTGTYWTSPNTGATNSTGFSALPGGSRSDEASFYDAGNSGSWWSATATDTLSAHNYGLSYNYASLNKGSSFKSCDYSIRLVKD